MFFYGQLKLYHLPDGPSFSVKPENIEAEREATAKLTCVVDGHPTPKITWLRYENQKFIVSLFLCTEYP